MRSLFVAVLLVATSAVLAAPSAHEHDPRTILGAKAVRDDMRDTRWRHVLIGHSDAKHGQVTPNGGGPIGVPTQGQVFVHGVYVDEAGKARAQHVTKYSDGRHRFTEFRKGGASGQS